MLEPVGRESVINGAYPVHLFHWNRGEDHQSINKAVIYNAVLKESSWLIWILVCVLYYHASQDPVRDVSFGMKQTGTTKTNHYLITHYLITHYLITHYFFLSLHYRIKSFTWVSFLVDNFFHSIESDHQKRVTHCEYHPYVNHLYVSSCR